MKAAGLFLGIMAIGLGAVDADAQTPDFCAGPLPYQADLVTVQGFRQQCTIQKLIAARADEANRAIAAEVQAAVEAAHAKAQAEALEEAGKRAEYWENYAKGLEAPSSLASALDATCSWRGTQNEPTARMCKLWHSR